MRKQIQSQKRFYLIISILILVVVAIVCAIVVLRNRTTGDGNTRKIAITDDRQARKELKAISEQIHVQIFRYDSDIFSIDKENVPTELQRLTNKYPLFIEKNAWKNERYLRQLTDFLNDPYIQEIHQEVARTFPDLNEEEAQLQAALSIYKYYFPEAVLPSFYGVVAGIDPAAPFVLYADNEIIINLDWYLGSNYKYYQDYRIPQYIRTECVRENIVLDCFRRALAYRHLPQQTPITLLDYMIEEGKVLYFTELMFPEVAANAIVGYSDSHFAWAEQYQADVWNYLIENKLLFSKDAEPIRRLVQEAPFSNPFKDSPGRIGAYIGWKIIVSYMEKHPEISLNQLMQNGDSRLILNSSGYKPLK